MKNDEFTEEDLIRFFEKYDQGGKIPAKEFEKIVFDTRFPEHLFESAKEKLKELNESRERYKIVWQLSLENYNEQIKILQEIIEIVRSGKEEEETERVLVLEDKVKELKISLKTIEEELEELVKKIGPYSKG